MSCRKALTALAAALLVVLTAPVSSAVADEVSRATDRVQQLQQLQLDTTRKLLDGTRRWEADQDRLRSAQMARRNARRHVRQAEDAVAGQRSQVAAVARTLYMQPTSNALQLALTRTPDQVLDTVRAQGLLNQAAGSQAQIIARATSARHRLQIEQLRARTLADEAARLETDSARRLAQLQALAQSTSDRLAQAQASLDSSRAQARRAALARAARNRSIAGPACTGRSTAGQQNGNLDPGSLCPLWKAPGHRLRADAAAAFNRMSQYYAATVGRPLCVTDSYRTYQEQVSLYRRKPGLAAVPGTSEHGWGKAVDFCGGVQNTGSAAYNWMKANAGRFGWFHPDWAEPSGSKPEPWHWEFSG